MKKVVISVIFLLLAIIAFVWASQSQNLTVQKIFGRVTKGVLPEKNVVPVVELTREQKLLAAIDIANPAVATIHTGVGTAPSVKELTEKFIARAVILSQDGYIATATAAFETQRAKLGEFSILIPGIGEPFDVKRQEAFGPITILKIDAEPSRAIEIDAEPVGSRDVVALGGDVIMSPAMGMVVESADLIQTDLSQRFALGTPLIGQNGALIGLYVSIADPVDKDSERPFLQSFLPSEEVQNAFAQFQGN